MTIAEVLAGVGVGPDNEQVRLRIRHEFERLMRQGDGPRLADFLSDLGEYETKGDATIILEVVADRVLDVRLIP